jgi:mannose-1-phosphate guanylyltransferase/mannose-6-phosphate isomerase
MSRRLLPKQFLPLLSERTLLQETVLRAQGLRGLAEPILLCNEEHRFLVAEQLRDAGIGTSRIILEPAARGTAPAVAAAALSVVETDPGAVLLVLAADHLIRDVPAFHRAAQVAIAAAERGSLVTFGIAPTSPETGYGYIERGERLPAGDAHRVARFVEKPDAATAQGFLASGRFLWNSGMFVLGAARYLSELERLRPEIVAAVRSAWDGRHTDLGFCKLAAEAFSACANDSIDRAVMERTRDAAVVAADMGWSDVGSWATLWEVARKDAQGNARVGDVDLEDSRNCYVRADGRLVSVIGADDLVVIETSDAVLIAHRGKAQAVKEAVSRLDRNKRTEHVSHKRVYRPWGYYESIDGGGGFQVKRLMVKPGEALSLQRHKHRAEHWVVVSGTARITRGDEVFGLKRNESTYIPAGSKHRLENPGPEPLYLIEVQSGDYLGEDDIERFDDRYRRS